MIVWLDNHLSPALARWIESEFEVACTAVRDLDFATSPDPLIFDAARTAGALIITKDADFAGLVSRLGPPPSVIWLTCGNTSTAALCELLGRTLPPALALVRAGEALVEIGGRP